VLSQAGFQAERRVGRRQQARRPEAARDPALLASSFSPPPVGADTDGRAGSGGMRGMDGAARGAELRRAAFWRLGIAPARSGE
jgi:hypothetical protein